MSCSHTWNPECIDCLEESLLRAEQALTREKSESLKLREALMHARYRGHEHSPGCDACQGIDDVLSGVKG
jgi:hypothetical protein